MVIFHPYWVSWQILHPFWVKPSHSFHSLEVKKGPMSFTFGHTHPGILELESPPPPPPPGDARPGPGVAGDTGPCVQESPPSSSDQLALWQPGRGALHCSPGKPHKNGREIGAKWPGLSLWDVNRETMTETIHGGRRGRGRSWGTAGNKPWQGNHFFG